MAAPQQLLMPDGRVCVGAQPRVLAPQAGATLAKVPWRTLVGMAAKGSANAATGYSHAGYEWFFAGQGTPSNLWGDATLRVGRRVGPDVASTTASFTGADQYVFVEMAGIRGQVLWAKVNNTNTATTVTTTAPSYGFNEAGLIFVAGAATKTVAGAPSGVHSAGLIPIADVSQTISRFYVWRYVPGTRPTVAWTCPSAQNNGFITAIIR